MTEPGASLSPRDSTAASPAVLPKAAPAAVPGISACVITLNEADRIEACLRSLAFCDEIILVDSGSSDATQELARANGAIVSQNPFAGYRSQKQFAVGLARHDWVLCIDADERVSDELRASIEAARAGGFSDAAGYKFPRANEYFGRVLRHGNAHPDRALRLFDRRRGAWRGYEIHESVKTEGPVRRLAGSLAHNPYRSFSDQLQRNSRYAQMMAANMHAAGRRAHLHNLILNPFWRFLRGYVIRLGFLDGWRGLIYALVRAQYVQQKFVALWLLQQRQRL
jgi:glycosyltransferase involved in cell wall biosynthesis